MIAAKLSNLKRGLAARVCARHKLQEGQPELGVMEESRASSSCASSIKSLQVFCLVLILVPSSAAQKQAGQPQHQHQQHQQQQQMHARFLLSAPYDARPRHSAPAPSESAHIIAHQPMDALVGEQQAHQSWPRTQEARFAQQVDGAEQAALSAQMVEAEANGGGQAEPGEREQSGESNVEALAAMQAAGLEPDQVSGFEGAEGSGGGVKEIGESPQQELEREQAERAALEQQQQQQQAQEQLHYEVGADSGEMLAPPEGAFYGTRKSANAQSQQQQQQAELEAGVEQQAVQAQSAEELAAQEEELNEGGQQVAGANQLTRGDQHESQEPTEQQLTAGDNSSAAQLAALNMNAPLNDEQTFATPKLPSQYDAVLRLPPEGYYDDYFKPVPSSLAAPPASTMSSLFNQMETPEASSFIGPPSERQQQQQAKQEHRFEIEEASGNSSQHAKMFADQRKPHKQLEALEQQEHFFAHNRTSAQEKTNDNNNNNNAHEESSAEALGLNYDQMPSVFDTNQTNGSRASLDAISSQTHFESADNAHSNQRAPAKAYPARPAGGNQSRLAANSTQPQDDAIQLIIANTNNSSRDPLSNEKVINYTSEGQNITRLAGKPPRNTFVNKDMNEFPPLEPHLQQPQLEHSPGLSLVSAGQLGRGLPRIQSGAQNQPSEQDETEGGERYELRASPQRQPQAQQLRAFQPEENRRAAQQQQRVARQQAAPEQQQAEEAGQMNEEQTNGQESELGRAAAAHSPRAFNQHSSQSLFAGRQQQSNNTENALSFARQPQNALERSSSGHEKQRQRHHHHHHHHHHHQGHKHQRQQSMRRPQVSQVSFNPKDLVLNPPTAAPSEGAIESLTELPTKVKKLRANQPDKNELMNELLTALDRVKVAIYKLQPLTAKMNAIYRKSVTSNTRDIIMDNHKGTYAKRYPPGDYDDTYDRIHPSELLDRQQREAAAKKRNSRASGRRNVQSRPSNNMQAAESAASAVYMAAPKELLEQLNATTKPPALLPINASTTTEAASFGAQPSEAQLVATGFGRRLGDGRLQGSLSLAELSSNEADLSGLLEADSSSAAGSVEPTEERLQADQALSGGDAQSPLFGYRITIYQTPEEAADDEDADAESVSANEKAHSEHLKEQFSYQIDGLDGTIERLRVTADQPGELVGLDQEADSMATSESSVSERPALASADDESNRLAEEEAQEHELASQGSEMKASPSGKKFKKSEEESESDEEGKKKREAAKKSAMRKKKMEEEKKKKKEYKKIMHNKGVVSKEKKTMHRDKHIKAHDRGAAKEKALKERTQIEFFEREQIVDDEFEKGKKSTVKANWEVGHDSKKTIKDNHNMQHSASNHDPMSSAGSHEHLVAQESKNEAHDKAQESEKSSGIALAASSGKKSHKFEKKDLAAKGKKFKGWREKGYKIITETEFIDRGSLHDSAYKKRDKGAAHHQKYKKHHSSSEGHHGSMHETHKKSSKKEEKKSKSHEKKASHSKKSEREKEGKKEGKKGSASELKAKVKGAHEEHGKSMSASNEEPSSSEPETERPDEENLDIKESRGVLIKELGDRNNASLQEPRRQATSRASHQTNSFNSFKPALTTLQAASATPVATLSSQSLNLASMDNRTLARLIMANHHEEPASASVATRLRSFGAGEQAQYNASFKPHQVDRLNLSTFSQANHHQVPNQAPFMHRHQRNNNHLLSETTQRAESAQNYQQTKLPLTQQSLQHRNNLTQAHNQTVASERSSPSATTILDIIDNITGRQLNKTRIGTYELEEHNNGTSNQQMTNNSTRPQPATLTGNLGGLHQAVGGKGFGGQATGRQTSLSTTIAPSHQSSPAPTNSQQNVSRTTSLPAGLKMLETSTSQAPARVIGEKATPIKQRRDFGDNKLFDFDPSLGEKLLMNLLEKAKSYHQQQRRDVQIENQPPIQMSMGEKGGLIQQISQDPMRSFANNQVARPSSSPSNQAVTTTSLPNVNSRNPSEQTELAAQFLRYIHKANQQQQQQQQQQNDFRFTQRTPLVNPPLQTRATLINGLIPAALPRNQMTLLQHHHQAPFRHLNQQPTHIFGGQPPMSAMFAATGEGVSANANGALHQVAEAPFLDYDHEPLASISPHNFLTE